MSNSSYHGGGPLAQNVSITQYPVWWVGPAPLACTTAVTINAQYYGVQGKTSVNPFTATGVRIRQMTTSAAAIIRFGLFSVAGAALIDTGAITGTAVTEGYNNYAFTTPYTIAANTPFWLVAWANSSTMLLPCLPAVGNVGTTLALGHMIVGASAAWPATIAYTNTTSCISIGMY